MATDKGKLLDTAYAQLGDLYHWGGNGPDRFDCSGFICYCWRAAGYRDGDYSADTMFDNFRTGRWAASKITDPKKILPGDIVFYGKDTNASHVVMAVSPSYVIGASGGAKSTDTDAEAKARGAMVRIDKRAYRADQLAVFRPGY